MTSPATTTAPLPVDGSEDEPSEELDETRSPVITAFATLQSGGDMRAPMEALIEQTLSENPIYSTRQALLSEEDPQALIFWGKTISATTKKLKKDILAPLRDSNGNSLQNSAHPIMVVFINFHAAAIDKFLLASVLDPAESFRDVQPAALASLTPPRKSGQSKQKFPALSLCYEWGLASLRYGKVLEEQRDINAACSQFDNAVKLFMRIIQEDRRRKWTSKVLTKIVNAFECLARVKPDNPDVRVYCDLFLVQFSNLAMRGDMNLSVKPLVAMSLSSSRHIRNANAVDVLRHLASFFQSNLAADAGQQLEYLESMLEAPPGAALDHVSVVAKRRLERSGLTQEEYADHKELLAHILQWPGQPPSRVSQVFTRASEDLTATWVKADPRPLFTDQSRLTAKEGENGYVCIARRKQDRIPVVLKVMPKWAENERNIKREVALLAYRNKYRGFTRLLDVYQHNDEVWAVEEYCDAGNLFDVLRLGPMNETIMAFVVREILLSILFLHRRNRMLRDFTADDVLINVRGDVLIADLELWMGASSQRYWLSPELIKPKPNPYGQEVDIWCLGCIIMEMAEGYPPYADIHPLKEIFYTATKGAPPLSQPSKWTVEFRNFLKFCFNPSPSKRHTAEQLMVEGWLQRACTRNEFAEFIHDRLSSR